MNIIDRIFYEWREIKRNYFYPTYFGSLIYVLLALIYWFILLAFSVFFFGLDLWYIIPAGAYAIYRWRLYAAENWLKGKW